MTILKLITLSAELGKALPGKHNMMAKKGIGCCYKS